MYKNEINRTDQGYNTENYCKPMPFKLEATVEEKYLLKNSILIDTGLIIIDIKHSMADQYLFRASKSAILIISPSVQH